MLLEAADSFPVYQAWIIFNHDDNLHISAFRALAKEAKSQVKSVGGIGIDAKNDFLIVANQGRRVAAI